LATIDDHGMSDHKGGGVRAQPKRRLEYVAWARFFDSPSGAASAIAVTAKGKTTRLNGWGLWHVQRPGKSEWVPLEELRKEAAPERHKAAQKILAELGLIP
jgi:hypothetical protein